MTWLYMIILTFSVLTLFFVYKDYKKHKFTQKSFALVCFMESAVIIITSILIAISFVQ